MKLPTVRQINAHLWCGQRYCYVDLPDGRRMRISRARTRKGIMEGRIINTSGWEPKHLDSIGIGWEPIPEGSSVELS